MKRTFPELILFSLFLVLNVATAFFYNFGNEVLLMLPIRLGAAFINGMGISLLLTWSVKCFRKYLRIDIAPFLITRVRDKDLAKTTITMGHIMPSGQDLVA